MIPTRLNINNVDLAMQKIKRDRAINYWKERVINDFLPPIDVNKQIEIGERKMMLQTSTGPPSSLTRAFQFKI